jgi:hypothetical protein
LNARGDANGERWLISEINRTTNSLQYRIFDLSTGTDEVIYTRDPSEYYARYGFIGDDLITHQALCEIDCTVELQTIDGNEFSYPLPDTPGGLSIYSFYRSHDNKLTIGRLGDFWLLSADASPELLGYAYLGGSHLPPDSSPDNRFILLAETYNYPQLQRKIVDNETHQVIVALPEELENSVYMTYVSEGFIVNTLNRGNRIMYRYATQDVINLPDIGYGDYFDILPDRSVLYRIASTQAEQIYRYNPQTNETLLLIENVFEIGAVDVTYYNYP